MKKMILFACLLSVLLVPTASYPAIIMAGSYPTLQDALLAAHSGDIVSMEAKIYTGANNAYTLRWPDVPNVTLQGFGPNLTTIDAQANDRFITCETSPTMYLQGMMIQNAHISVGNGGCFNLQQGTSIHLNNVYIWNCGPGSFGEAGGIFEAPSCYGYAQNCSFEGCGAFVQTILDGGGTWEFTGCTFNSDGGTTMFSGGIVKAAHCIFNANNEAGNEMFNGVSLTATDCAFSYNQNGTIIRGGDMSATRCVFYGNGGYGHPVIATGTNNVSLVNCSFTDNGIGAVHASGGTMLFSNSVVDSNFCTFYGNVSWDIPYASPLTFYPAIASNGSATFNNCLIWNNNLVTGELFSGVSPLTVNNCDTQFDASGMGSFNFIMDPMVVSSVEPYDVHLTAISPCIDTCSNSGAPATDLDGVTRPQPVGGLCDIGAYEYTGTTHVRNMTKNRRYFTLFAAFRDAAAGNVISLDAGTYTGAGMGHDIVWPNLNNITLSGAGPNQTTLEAEGLDRVISIEGNVDFTIQNLTISDGLAPPFANGPYQSGGGLYYDGTGVAKLYRCAFVNNYTHTSNFWSEPSGCSGGGAYIQGTAIATSCAFIGNATQGSGIAGVGGGLFADHAAIANCTFYGNATGPSISSYYDEGAGLYVVGSSPSTIINSVFWNNNLGAPFVGGNSGGPEIYCNSTTPGQCVVSYSDIQDKDNNGTTNVSLETSDISAEPSFVSESLPLDLHLRTASPCIDIGTTMTGTNYDLDGLLRPQGRGYDMGCYERGPWPVKMYLVAGSARVRFFDGNIISPKLNSIQLEPYYPFESSLIAALSMTVDGTPVTLTGASPLWNGSFTPSTSTKQHLLTFTSTDELDNIKVTSMMAITEPGAAQVVGTVLNYPNPFNPLSSDPTRNTTTIQYTLSNDSHVTVVVYDITGHQVMKQTFSSGLNGGRAGINQVTWSGKNLFNKVVGNGMYLYQITSGDKVIGTGKLVILDAQ